MSFIAECLAGRASINDIDDAVDDWHEGRAGEGLELREHLGMSADEYSIWATKPSALAGIVEARRQGFELQIRTTSGGIPK
ncbi:hypothetical protein [Pseudomonas putida]|uniref:Uncharacterized protein n=1 Tax=Pseudomonas putida TaxID=303 RepID=A0A8I1EIG4_PSEPU|nr:hypothetical protein [Pseudomonas putida]MBI6885799.1 hypothetical protein [Pseudomonas putida]